MVEQKSFIKDHVLFDASFWAVIGGNAFSIFMALTQGWSIGEIMWIYWFQSVIIGIINFIRIWTLKEFSTDNFEMNGSQPPPTEATKKQTAIFFLVHYGFFHVVYSVFLWQQMSLTEINWDTLFFVFLCCAGFLGAHSYSFRHNLSRDFKQQKPNIGTVMFYPYLRIIPMHLTIIFGGMATDGDSAMYVLTMFMGLKTLADAGMHAIEHYLFQKPKKDLAI